MPDSYIGDLLGKIAVATGSSTRPALRPTGLGTGERVLLAGWSLAAYAVCATLFGVAGLPAVPGLSTLLDQGQPFYALPLVVVVLPLLSGVSRPIVGRVAFEAPLFCALLGLLFLPVHGGDTRNALLDAGGASAYVRMIVELALLGVALLLAYAALVRRVPAVATDADEAALTGEAVTIERPDASTPAERLITVASQTGAVLVLLWALGQSPAKGQAMLGVALAGGLASGMLYKSQPVRGSVWYVAGTILAGLIAYAWTCFHPDGAALGDASGLLAGPARVLPLHYATAGAAGTIYGYWTARASEAEQG